MKQEWKWIALLLFATAIWGSTFALMKSLLSSLDTFALLAIRFSIAAALFGAYFAATKRKLAAAEIKHGAILGLFMFAVFAAQVFGLNYTTATNSGLITGLYVIFTPIISALALRRLPERKVPIAAALSFAGLWLLTGASANFNLGDAVTVLTAIAAALQIVFTSKYVQKSNPESLVLVQVATVAVISSIVMLASGTVPKEVSADALFWLAFLAVFATIIAFLIMTKAQRVLDAPKAALVMVAEPVFAALFGFLILGELLSPVQMFGGLLILGSVLLVESDFAVPALPE
ncbi:MAG: DMT family transporter [Candidatus Anstonellaceae archaeon]